MPEHVTPQQPHPPDAEIGHGSVAEADYAAFCALMRETARGRALLDEYVRRHHGADTKALWAALQRIERLVSEMMQTQAEAASTETKPAQPTIEAKASPPEPQPHTDDPAPETIARIMAQVMALSEAERIALFS
jgi:hypothetical protein